MRCMGVAALGQRLRELSRGRAPAEECQRQSVVAQLNVHLAIE